MPVFTTRLHWVCDIDPHRIALTSCPPGEDRLAAHIEGWKAQGIDVVVSLQELDEQSLCGVKAEARLCERSGLSFLSFPIRDHGVPEAAEEFAGFVRQVHGEVASGRAVLVHCLAGIGRTGLLTSGVLLLLGVPRSTIADVLRRSRGFVMPETPEQRQWLEAFYENLATS